MTVANAVGKYLSTADLHFERREIKEALRYYDLAYELHPESVLGSTNRWKCLALLGLFERAWADTDLFEAARRAKCGDQRDLPLHLRRVWNGEPISGNHLNISCYHGLGDTLQFVRYASLASAIASGITLECQTSLIELLDSVQGIDSIVPLGSEERDKSAVHCELMELPYIFRTTLDSIPSHVPYIRPPHETVSLVQKKMQHSSLDEERFNVGIVWTSGNWNPRRNIGVDQLRSLAEIPNVCLFCLQNCASRSDRDISNSWMNFLGDSISLNITNTASAIMSLDLVISVDTMSAHLAGALGSSVWTLLPFDADWRWMTERTETPWYPTMRLFRQPNPNNWTDVIDRVRQALVRAADDKKRFGRTKFSAQVTGSKS
jgi:hypothetical protein